MSNSCLREIATMSSINKPTVLPIVIVDDDPEWSAVIADHLRTEGYQVWTAENGEEGLKVLEEVGPALVVLDLIMPKMSGTEMLRELNRRGQNVLTLVVTGEQRPYLINEAMMAGAAGILHKPVSPANLLRSIRRLMDA